jgi:hypothetical protein
MTLQQQFDETMLDIYRRARDEAGYHATRFLRMLNDLGGLETARTLLHAANVSDGYTALWERQRLDLTVEAVILDRRWASLFTNEERESARQRLEAYGFNFSVEE